MSFDPQATRSKVLNHLAMMAAHPGLKAHAWHRANELAKECPEMFGDMPALLTERMRTKSSEKPPRNGG